MRAILPIFELLSVESSLSESSLKCSTAFEASFERNASVGVATLPAGACVTLDHCDVITPPIESDREIDRERKIY